MNKEDKESLVRHLNITQEWEDRFFDFQESTKVQLLSNQLQYFQSLGSIGLAVIAILFGTQLVRVSIWWMLAAITGLLLVIYVSTNIRESNDAKSKDLDAEGINLKKSAEANRSKILEAVEADNIKIFTGYVEQKNNTDPEEPPHTSYAGEIAVFLFLVMLFWSLMAFLKPDSLNRWFLAFFICAGLVFCFVVAVFDWNLKLTALISRGLHFILRK